MRILSVQTLLKVVGCYDLSVLSMSVMGLPKKVWALSKFCFWIFGIFLTLQSICLFLMGNDILFFLWFPLCRGEAGLFVTPMYGYFCNSFPLVPVVGLFSPLFFLLCLSQVSLHTILPS